MTKAEPRRMTAKELWSWFTENRQENRVIRYDCGRWQVCWEDPGCYRVLGEGATPEEAIAASLGAELAPDPQARALGEVVAELEAERLRIDGIQRITGSREDARFAGQSVGIGYALSLLRRVAPGEDTEPTAESDLERRAREYVVRALDGEASDTMLLDALETAMRNAAFPGSKWCGLTFCFGNTEHEGGTVCVEGPNRIPHLWADTLSAALRQLPGATAEKESGEQ